MHTEDLAFWARTVEGTRTPGGTEYDLPPVTGGFRGREGRIRDGDALLLACRRGEREVQITRAFADPALDAFPRAFLPRLAVVTLTQYHASLAFVPSVLEPLVLDDTLGQVVSEAGLRQLRVAESEKFAHVTRFLDGGRSDPFPGQENVRVPSRKDRTPAQDPAMACDAVARAVVEGILARTFRLVAVNFANGDVVGHLLEFAPKVAAAAAVDAALGRIADAAREAGFALAVCADHGVLETGLRPDGTPNVGHTTAPVPLVLSHPGARPAGKGVTTGALRDVAPTVLPFLGLDAPCAMTGTPRALASGPCPGVVLVVLDGWGLGEASAANPIHVASTPVMDGLLGAGPRVELDASGEAVGLLPGKAGNSESGHLNIGAGRTVPQDDARVERGARDGTLASNPALRRACAEALGRGGRCHVLGMLSDRSSHGTLRELAAFARGAAAAGAPEVFLHLITDGRSAPPGSAPALIHELGRELADLPQARIATALGRGYALDRDGNWEAKTRVAYEALVGTGGTR